MNMFNLKGKKAIVTGASGGIGYALVKGMVEAGIEVAMLDYSESLEQIRDEVEQDIHILPSLKNKEIIKRCSSQGIFQIKSAVTSVAKILNISKNTVYLHLKSLE